MDLVLVMGDGRRVPLVGKVWASVKVNDLLLDNEGGQYKVIEIIENPDASEPTIRRTVKYERAT